jgi:RHS repeat-associated protein
MENVPSVPGLSDANGLRIRKVSPSGTADYVYDLAGHAVSEVSGSGVWNRGEVYAGGRHLATYRDNTTYFTQSDWLGTERARTTLNGSQCETTVNLPFGDGQATSGTCDPSPNHFTGKQRDSETGLDYFGARYYGSNIARWMSPDWAAKPTSVPYAEFGDPQSLNLYGYVRDNPLNRFDPDGHYEVNPSGCDKQKHPEKCQKKYDKANERFEEARKKDLNSKDPRVRAAAAAAAYGDPGTKNGVHVGFADLSHGGPQGEPIKGDVKPFNSGAGKLIDIQVRVDINLDGTSLQETIAHEGTHVGDEIRFLTSYNFATGKYDSTTGAALTVEFTEFNAYRAGAGVEQEHGFGPHDVNKIINFIHKSPLYKDILYQPIFPNNADYPQ